MPLFFTISTTDAIIRRNPVPKSALTRPAADSVTATDGAKKGELVAVNPSMCSVCELIASSSKLRWLLVPAVSSSVQVSIFPDLSTYHVLTGPLTILTAVQSAYFVGSFNADVIAVAVGLEVRVLRPFHSFATVLRLIWVYFDEQWVGWCSAIEIVIGSSISPFVGRLSDLYGRLPFYYTGLTINICSALYVARVGADMDETSIVSKNDEFCIKTEKFCIKNEELCI